MNAKLPVLAVLAVARRWLDAARPPPRQGLAPLTVAPTRIPTVDPAAAATWTQAAWWSADALAWTPGGTRDGDLQPTYEDAAVATPRGFVADAWSDACTSWLWLSADGTAWDCIANAPVTPHPNRTYAASGQTVVSVDPDGTTWVAILGG